MANTELEKSLYGN